MGTATLDITVNHRLATPLHAQISEQIRRMIESQELTPGEPLPTSNELCARLNINYRTAHRAMATLAREGYVTRQARRGTVVRGVPVRNVIAIFAWMELFGPRTSYEYYRLIMEHLGRQLEAHERSYRIYLGSENSGTRSTACADLLQHLSSGALAGVLVLNAFPQAQQLISDSRTTRSTLISLSGGVDLDYSIHADFPGYVRAAAEYLRSQGRRRIGVIYNSSSPSFPNAGVVHQILRDTLGGEPAEQEHVVGRIETEQGGYEAASRLPLDRLDGLIVQDDIMALGVDRRLREINVSVPGRLMVATFWSHGSRLRLALPFVRFEHDVEEQARQAVRMLQDVSAGRRIERRHIRLCPTLRAGRDSA